MSAAKQRHPIPVPHIAACLIAKNSEATIQKAIDSIRPFVDEINVYDTGSTDGTIALLQELNEYRCLVLSADGTVLEMQKERPVKERADCRYLDLAPITVKKGQWRNDFAWAREQSFKMASPEADWLFWLDDDDEIIGAEHLAAIAYRALPEQHGFMFQYDYAHDEAGNLVCVLWRERLMRREAGYRWINPVHEVLIPPEGMAPALQPVPAEQVRYVHHRPPDRYAPSRNLEILLAAARKAEKKGERVDPRTLAYLGTEHMAQGQFGPAVPYLQAYLEHPESGWSDERAQVQHKLATCLRLIGNPLAAVNVEMAAITERDDWAENYVGLAETFAALQRWDRVERWAKRGLELGMPQSMLILNPLEFTLLPLLRLVEATANLGRFDEAQSHLEAAAKAFPNHPAVASQAHALSAARHEGESIEAVLKLREMLVRHDENLKALQVVESAPYYIAEHPLIVKARAEQREMCKHYLRPEEYVRWYADEPKESTFPWEHIDLIPGQFPRVQGLLDGLAEQEAELGRKPRCLDLGCNDWALVGASLWRAGYACDGVELNRKSYENALELVKEEGASDEVTIAQGDLHDAPLLLGASKYGCPIVSGTEFNPGSDARLLTEDQYDAVSIFEVLEHVPDVGKALDVAESLLRPGGRVYLSTPNGAFERGNLPEWNRVERKGHLRATPVHELAEQIIERGQIEDVRLHVGPPDDPRLTFLSYVPRKPKGKVIFYAGGSWEEWSPASIQQGGLGGSETALAQVSARIAMAGYAVKVYSGATPGIYAGGALWRPHTAWDPTEECDLLVVSRQPHVFDNPLGAKQTALWCHDHSYPGAMTEARAEKIDHIVTLSEWQRDRFARLYPYAQEKLRVIRNGIGRFDTATGEDRYAAHGERTFSERKPRVVYSSSCDRGLDVLLKLWPQIRERVPKAELHVFYGFNVFDAVAIQQPQLQDYKRALLAQVEALGGEKGGIHLRGRVGQQELAAEMGQARVWGYPTAFLETSCIGAMEARACGLPIVTSALAALNETVGSHGILLPWIANEFGLDEEFPFNASETYGKAFVEDVARLLSDSAHWRKWQERARRGIDSLDWSERVSEWEALVAQMERNRTNSAELVAA